MALTLNIIHRYSWVIPAPRVPTPAYFPYVTDIYAQKGQKHTDAHLSPRNVRNVQTRL